MDKNGRKKIQIKYIEDKSRRHITFSKRKAGIMKKVRPQSGPPSFKAGADQSLARSTTGLRAEHPYWDPSASSGRLGDWPRLHVHDVEVAAAGHQARGQKPDPGRSPADPFILQTLRLT